MTRPSETVAAILGSIFGAIQILVGAFSKDGFTFSDLQDPEVTGAITVLISFAAAAVTWFVARQQRAGDLKSASDGTVQG